MAVKRSIESNADPFCGLHMQGMTAGLSMRQLMEIAQDRDK